MPPSPPLAAAGCSASTTWLMSGRGLRLFYARAATAGRGKPACLAGGAGRRSGLARSIPWRAAGGLAGVAESAFSTAGSILSSAYKPAFSILDGNCNGCCATDASPRASGSGSLAGSGKLSDFTARPGSGPRAFKNQPLMDLGPRVARPANPPADRCPWQGTALLYAMPAIPCFTREDATRPLPFQLMSVGRGAADAGAGC